MSSRPLAVITGASSGIGAEFARQLAAYGAPSSASPSSPSPAQAGYDLLLTAPDESGLQKVAAEIRSKTPVHVEILVGDLTTDADRDHLADRVRTAPNLGLLVNCAGFGTVGLFHKTDLQAQDRMHRLHILTVIALTHAALNNLTGQLPAVHDRAASQPPASPSRQDEHAVTSPSRQGGDSAAAPSRQDEHAVTPPSRQGGDSAAPPSRQDEHAVTAPSRQGGDSPAPLSRESEGSLTAPSRQAGDSAAPLSRESEGSLTALSRQGGDSAAGPSRQGGDSQRLHPPRGIINVGSIASFFQAPMNVSYCATKAWIRSFTEGISMELASQNSQVQIQLLCPGFTYSSFHDQLGVDRGLLPKRFWTTADFVVRESLKGFARNKLVVMPGWRYRASIRLLGCMPASLRRWYAIQGIRRQRKYTKTEL